MLDNFARGRCRHVWFSISADLRLDAQRFVNKIDLMILLQLELCLQSIPFKRDLSTPGES